MPRSHYPDIRALHPFADMAESHFEKLMQASFVQTFPPQVQLITAGETSDFLHVVLTGCVELFSTWEGRETTMATVRPISTLILAATIRDAPYLMSARTLEQSRIALIPSQSVREMFDNDIGFARAVVGELAHCYRAMVKAQKDIKLRSSTERLANYILRQHGRAGTPAGVPLGLEKRKLASLLGMTPENLSRALRNLSQHGVSAKGGSVVLASVEQLEAFAKPSPLIDNHRI